MGIRSVCFSVIEKLVYVSRPRHGANLIIMQALNVNQPLRYFKLYTAWAWAGKSIRPYFFIFLYKVTRLMPRALAARERV